MAMALGTRGGKRRGLCEINITPFTDVCLVLLIIFMVSASFMGPQRGLDVKLPAPSTDSEKDKRPARDISVSISRSNVVTIEVSSENGPVSSTIVTDKQIIPTLSKTAARYKVNSVTIKPERGVIYNNVVHVMDAVKEAGIEAMALSAEQPGPTPGPAT